MRTSVKHLSMLLIIPRQQPDGAISPLELGPFVKNKRMIFSLPKQQKDESIYLGYFRRFDHVLMKMIMFAITLLILGAGTSPKFKNINYPFEVQK